VGRFLEFIGSSGEVIEKNGELALSWLLVVVWIRS